MKLNIHIKGGGERKKNVLPSEADCTSLLPTGLFVRTSEVISPELFSYTDTVLQGGRRCHTEEALRERFSEAEHFAADGQPHRFTPAGTLTSLGSRRACVMAQAGGR